MQCSKVGEIRLFLPLDFAVGRNVTDSLTISLEASAPIVNDYPVYNFKTELRMICDSDRW